MFKINPYRPGAGLTPKFLAGREKDIEEADSMFEALKYNIPVQSVIYSGLRGVGKTVLINKFYDMAIEKGVFCKHIEVETRKDFISQIATGCQSFLRDVSGKEKLKALIHKSVEAIKSLVISFDPENNTFSLSVQEKELYKMSNLSMSLTEVFTSVGSVAQEAGVPICFFVDEMQYMKKDELSALIGAVHRVNQLSYPIMIIGAGLPKIIKMLSDAKSYSERLFAYKSIGSLEKEEAKKAIVEPAKIIKTEYSGEAVDKIIEITKGYPFFIQQLCKIICDNTDGNFIDVSDVEKNTGLFLEALDNGFFRSRYERCSDSEKAFIFSMVTCGNLPCNIGNVSKKLGKEGKAVSPVRAKLIDKGVIYSTRYGELDFTVPEFDGFVKRLGEYCEWLEKKN